MDFELEWELKLFREEQPSLFDEVGERYSATPIGDKTAKRMLNIINLLESALEKQSEQQSNCNLPHVSISLLDENQMTILTTVADAYLYESMDNSLHIGEKGIKRVLEEWEKMKKQ